MKGDDEKLYILELNEPLRAIIQLDSKFYDLEGMRSTITVVTEGEKQTALMGFHFEGESSDNQPFEAHEDPGEALVIAPDDEVQGIEIDVPVQHAPEGRQVGDAHVVVRPARDDEIVVNGITLTAESSLASLRAACSTYGISQSGGKARCFSRLLNHQKNLELQTITHAAQDALNSGVRIPQAPTLAEPPSEALQDLHRLTHTPYQPWCESCVAHRARADRHPRDFSSKEGECPTVSFDYFFTKAGESSQAPDSLITLVMVDNKTGYLGCVPMNAKSQFDLATKEVIAFIQTLGYSNVQLRCDNEPSALQLQRLIVEARQRMGLQTQATTPSAYQHGNSLAENAVQRIRGLAGSLMHSLQCKLGGVVISSNHALWTWSMRHAAWLLNRFNPHQGLTPYEVVYGKPYGGSVCEYGEPVLGFSRTSMKGNPRWRRMLFIGKVENQDSFLLFDGTSLVLTRSVRRVKCNWVVYMAFYKEFNLYSWQYKVGFGSRVLPTKRRVTAKPVTFVPPIAPVEPSKLVDEDAEAVKAKAQEEQREQEELEKMSVFDRPEEIQRDVQFGDGRIFSDDGEMEKPPTAFGAAMDSSGASSSTFNVAPSPSLMPSSST